MGSHMVPTTAATRFSRFMPRRSPHTTDDRLDGCLRHARSIGDFGHCVIGRSAHVPDEPISLLPHNVKRLSGFTDTISELLKIFKCCHATQSSD